MFGTKTCATAMALIFAMSAASRNANAQQVAASTSAPMETITVTAQRLNEARTGIETQTGASTYTIDAAAIAATPGGDNTLLNQVLLQAPDVAQDSFGQFHVRGDHNGLQYRLNGIILPEGISVFGQTLSPRLISSMKLITGVLPSEYGLRTAGIVDLSTKGGALEPGGSVSMYGGSHNTIEPSFNYGGTAGNFTYFVSGDYTQNDLGIESPDGRSDPLHDHSTQVHGFGYFEDILNDQNRLTVVLGSSVGRFQIPNQSGLEPDTGFSVNGQSMFPSENLNENQQEITHYGIVSLQHSEDKFDLQTSFISRYSSLNFAPDPIGDILYDGIAQQAYKRDVALGLQSDAAYRLTDNHTLRAGFYVQTDRAVSHTTSQVLATDANGNPFNDVPVTIPDNGAKTQWIESVYVQDEWNVLPTVTINYGVRFDNLSAYDKENQVSPRVNVVWQPATGTTIHAGYARYFSPPPFELVGNETVAKFQNTTSPPLSPANDPVKAERDNYVDVGAEQKIMDGLTVGIDGYYKWARNLVDEGQFGAPIILTPFNYRDGVTYGAELTANYAIGPFSAYGNVALQHTGGKDIISSQFNFDPDDLAYIAGHYIHLDHEQHITASAGASYLWDKTRFSADMLVGSGLRADLTLPDGSGVPNGAHLPYYTQVNLGVSHAFEFSGVGELVARFDVTNLFDEVYQIRNGTGVGVGASQFGARRGFFGGLTKTF